MRYLAIDWSGARAARERIWLAEVAGGRLTRLESGRTREEVVRHLVAEAERDPELVVGLDFAFSFPEWFVEELGLDGPPDLWELVAAEGEEWLRACEPPFWGRPGRRRPDLPEHFRRTELEAASRGGAQPKSVFQVGGAGAVGTGSIRGMPALAELGRAGFSVWPFEAPRFPMVIEIYPRLLTGPVVKSRVEAREAHLGRHVPGLDEGIRLRALASEDAFDATVSALVISREGEAIRGLSAARRRWERVEGRIWAPEAAAEA